MSYASAIVPSQPTRPGEVPATAAKPHRLDQPSSAHAGELAADRPSPRGADRVELSASSRGVPTTSIVSTSVEEPVRTDLVARIRSLIASGTYETRERLDAATTKLIGQLDVTG